MRQIYVVLSQEGEFAAFWQKDAEAIRLFTPSGLWEKYFDVPWAQWESIKDHTSTENAVYPDIVNFAWNSLALKNIYISRSKAKITERQPGTYHPRLWRGIYGGFSSSTTYNPINSYKIYGETFLRSVIAAESLFAALIDLFRYVEPADGNLDTFGHRNREVLILACTEVEASWRGFLDSNGYSIKPPYNTVDYVKLNSILRLDQWQIGLNDYPSMGILRPFTGWDVAKPTQSLKWYSDYNGVKHNREAEFSKASLRNVINATAALYIIQAAQWGPETYDKFHYARVAPFYIISAPAYSPEEMYLPPLDNQNDMNPVNYFQ